MKGDTEATDYQTRQHREIEQALRSALATEDPDVKRSQFLDIADALTMHIAAEEEVFYPAVHRQPKLDAAQREALGREMDALQVRMQARGKPRKVVHEQTDAAQPLR